jgi:lipoyl(octanoyl) transferase
VDYVRKLEEVLIRSSLEFGVPTKRIKGLTGVWTDWQNVSDLEITKLPIYPITNSSEAKIAAIGVHISRSVTSHGFALNVNTDLDYFKLIVPCGIADKPVTSLAQELGREVDLSEVAQCVSRNFGRVFERQMLAVETVDELMRRVVGVPVKAPEGLQAISGEDTAFA